MNKTEAAELVDKQDRYARGRGPFSGLAPGVNGGQLNKAKRILDGEEAEDDPKRPLNAIPAPAPEAPAADPASEPAPVAEPPAPPPAEPNPNVLFSADRDGEETIPTP